MVCFVTSVCTTGFTETVKTGFWGILRYRKHRYFGLKNRHFRYNKSTRIEVYNILIIGRHLFGCSDYGTLLSDKLSNSYSVLLQVNTKFERNFLWNCRGVEKCSTNNCMLLLLLGVLNKFLKNCRPNGVDELSSF